MTDEEKRFDRREEARLDDMYDAQYAENEAFNRWWNDDGLIEDNPFSRDTPAFWAWEGWQAGVAAEREACAKVCEAEGERVDASWVSCAAAIRARGQE
jgi:hypothetical protein